MISRNLSVLIPLFVALTSCAGPQVLQDLSAGWVPESSRSPERTLEVPGHWQLDSPGYARFHLEVSSAEFPRESETLWLALGYLNFPMEIRLNGSLVGKWGKFPPENTYVQTSYPVFFPVPKTLFRPPPEVNRFELTAYSESPVLKFPGRIQLGGQDLADFQVLTKLYNGDFFLMFSGICLMGGFYFLSVWFGRKEDAAKLFFALATIFMALYFLELGSPIALFPGHLYRAVMKACLSFSVGFVILFFMEFFGIHNTKRAKNLVIAIAALSGLYVVLSPDAVTTMERFTTALIPLQVGIFFVVYLLIRALMIRHPEGVTLLVGIMVAVGFGTHDIYHQTLGTVPVAWLQGMGFFGLLGSMFLSLAFQSTRLYRTLETYSNELLVQKEELAKTNMAFARFVPKEFLAFLGKESIVDVALGDQVQQDMAILFSDIRDFTALSEKLTPSENFRLINDYLNRMAPMVRQEGGIVDKYIGDAIMALYPQGSFQAVLSALAMREALGEFNLERQGRQEVPLEMGIGIHTGSLMLGTIGEEARMEGTVISDAVNTASRIEGLTKVFQVPVIISGDVVQDCGELIRSYPVRYLGNLPVRGRSVGISLYELIHPADPQSENKIRHTQEFEACVQVWEVSPGEAESRFLDYAKMYPEDPALNFFLGKSSL